MSEAGRIDKRSGPAGIGYPQAALLALAGLLALRLALVILSPLELYADEAQYWRWGETLAWGYYSKPPMIAWVIRATTDLFGEAEWAVRFAAPVLHTISAGFLFLTARAMFDARTGFFAALVYALMPAVGLSSHVISTDGVLLPFWCAALWCLWRLRSGEGRLVTALALGAVFGLGMLAKYAMLYFLIGAGLALVFDEPTRRALTSGGRGLAALGVAGLIIAPHFAWNAANAFSTVSHTVDNAHLGGELFHPGNALDYLADQMGVFGPVSFLALLAGLVFLRAREGEAAARERWLLGFILPVLVFILAQAILSRAHANWTATAYPAASLLVAAWFCRAGAPVWRGPAVLWASLGLNGAVAGLFAAVLLMPEPAITRLGLDNALKRTRGWEASAEAIFAEAERLEASAVLVEEREAWHGLDFYGRHRPGTPLISWRRYPGPKSFSEAQPLTDDIAGRVLVASLVPELRPHLRSDFESFEPVGQVRVPLGQRSNGCPIIRVFQLYLASGHAPPERTAEWEARFAGEAEFPEPRCP